MVKLSAVLLYSDISHQQAAFCVRCSSRKLPWSQEHMALRLGFFDSLLVSAKNVGVREIFLGTMVTNSAARTVSTKNGFVEIDRTNFLWHSRDGN